VIVDVRRMLDALGIAFTEQHSELWARCPSPKHEEVEASWSINAKTGDDACGLHHCFGCGWGGTPVDLVAEVIGTQASSARQWLRDQGLVIGETVPLDVELVVRRRAASGLRVPTTMGGPLPAWATPARRYAEARGITPEQVTRWDLGYAVDGRLAGRVIFPVADELGRLRSFHARSFVGDRTRYMNATRRDGHDPGAVFGQRHWPPSLDFRKRHAVALTEGALDALACERAGSPFIGAIGGSEPTPSQIVKLSTWGGVIVATDNDKAGNKVAELIALGLGRHCQVARATMPPGADACDLTCADLAAILRECGETFGFST
jgi:DNA primase